MENTDHAAWLIEWPGTDIDPGENINPPRWWHPEHGWITNANAAMHFCRESDATAYIKEKQLYWAKATQHMFLLRGAA